MAGIVLSEAVFDIQILLLNNSAMLFEVGGPTYLYNVGHIE